MNAQRKRRLKVSATVLTIFIMVVVAVTLATRLERVDVVVVSGTVECLSGAPVAGVFVIAPLGRDNGFARLVRSPGKLSTGSYRHPLSFPGAYSLHVGCGGSRERWGSQSYSEDVRGTRNDFRCDDRPHILRCVRIS